MEYQVVFGKLSDSSEFGRRVNVKLSDGWEPTGGIFMLKHLTEEEGIVLLAQAVIRKK